MPRWSTPLKLTDLSYDYDYLKGYTGVYELGTYRSGYFDPKYIGRAVTQTNCLHRRLGSYLSIEKCHNSFLIEKLLSSRHNIYYRVMRTTDPAGTEARLLLRHGIGPEGQYQWNQRYEYSAIGY